QPSILPSDLVRRGCWIGNQPRDETRHDDDGQVLPIAAGECENVVRQGARAFEGEVLTLAEQSLSLAAGMQRPIGPGGFDPAIFLRGDKLPRQFATILTSRSYVSFQIVEQSSALVVTD